MLELQGKYNKAKVFTDNIDNETISQVIQLLNQPYIADSQIRIMPDTHAGAGCVIGTTMTLTDKVCCNLVGVDIGCLDKDTEILTPNGWMKISEYDNEPILVYDKNSDTAHFEQPFAYLKAPCDHFNHFVSNKGLNQMLSDEHKMLIWKGYKGRGYTQTIEMASDVFQAHNKNTKSNRTIKTTFQLQQTELPISDDMIRVLVMISADGHIHYSPRNSTYNIEFHFRKERKIKRAKTLLDNAKIAYKYRTGNDGSFYITATAISQSITKSLKQFYQASQRQLKILTDEIYHWDGTIDEKRNHKHFSSTDKINADVIQFAHAANGIRAGISVIEPDKIKHPNFNTVYNVYETKNEYVGFPKYQFQQVPSQDGYKYCFTTSTGFFIIRRENCISITGNCGMLAVQLQETDIDLPLLDTVINQYVPSGFDKHEHPVAKFKKLETIVAPIDVLSAYRSIGTLGGGNHFIEVDRDEQNHLWLVIHTGSRHLGIEICKHYQNLAYKQHKSHDIQEKIQQTIAKLKSEGKERDIENAIKVLHMQEPKIPKDLCYVTGQDFEHYLHDMEIAQEFAVLNRQTIADIIIKHMDLHVISSFQTIHNYIDTENKILRKGAVSAQAGERLIIPMNMRDGSLICIGKGNPDWNYSAPHGAGRIMSRSEAKDLVDMEEFTDSMKGIYSTSVVESTKDESPFAYKPMQEIMDNVQDTVEIQSVIKPIYNFKAH